MEQPRERICATCHHYGFKTGNPKGRTWAYCWKKAKWFRDEIEKPGETRGCTDWE